MGAVSRGRISTGGLIGVFTAEKRFRPVALFVAEAEAIAAAVFQKRRPAGEAGFVARLGRDALAADHVSALAAEKRAHIVDGLRVMIILSRHKNHLPCTKMPSSAASSVHQEDACGITRGRRISFTGAPVQRL